MKTEITLATKDRHYVGRVTGLDATYGFALDFIELRQISRGMHKLDLDVDGTYKITPGSTVNNRRNDTGYLRIAGGIATEITKAEAAEGLV